MFLPQSLSLLLLHFIIFTCNITNTFVSAHLFFQYPKPRSCFYGGYWGPDGDGPWRREPCDRAAGAPTAILQAGSQTCLSVHEFVAHPATYDVTLFYNAALGPGDSLDQVSEKDTVVLQETRSDDHPEDQTGYQRFLVDLPLNKTCETCTIQIKQWAEDFDWYYYACVDVQIVSQLDGSFLPDADALSPDQCVWEPAPARIRANILRSILIGAAILLDIFLVLSWLGWIYVCRKSESRSPPPETKSTSDDKSDEELADQNPDAKQEQATNNSVVAAESSTRCSGFMKRAREPRAKLFGLLILGWVLCSSLVVGIVLVGLKACWFGPEWASF